MEVEGRILTSLHDGRSAWRLHVCPSGHHYSPGRVVHSSLQSPDIQDKVPRLLGRFKLPFLEPQLGEGSWLLAFT